MKRALRAVLIIGIAATLAAGGVIIWGNKTFNQPGPLAHDAVIVIPQGAGLRIIAATLEQARVIRYPLLFTLKAKWSGAHRALKAGEYMFEAHISAAGVLAKLHEGHVVVHRITVPEGLTSQQVVALIEAAPALSGAVGDIPAEGALLPETYDYLYGEMRVSLLRRMMKARDMALASLWQSRAPDLRLPDPQAAVILASIVEKETADPTERPRIAAVFHNRLRRGMRLQSDPTVVYALTGGQGALERRLTRADLKIDNPYNTYIVGGLPPGPIANPGEASLAAVLQPADTEELYFVADGTGGHAFAKTLREHNRNVARWRRIRKKLQKNAN